MPDTSANITNTDGNDNDGDDHDDVKSGKVKKKKSGKVQGNVYKCPRRNFRGVPEG